MSRLLRIAPLALALATLAGEASAYTTITTPASRWIRDWTVDGVHWAMNEAGCPDMSLEQAEAALEASFQTWEDVDCSLVSFIYDGRVPQATTGNDGVNLMVWVTSGWIYGSGALGVTGNWFGGGVISDADIEYNSVHWSWSETGAGGTIDLQSVATHEDGHFLGLGHTDAMGAVMFPTYSGGTAQRFLSDDDRAGVCFLYPTATGGCTVNDDCPMGYACQAGDCVPAGDGEVCSLCASHDDCGGPSDFCVRYPDGASRCGAACSTAEDCTSAPGCGARACDCVELSGGGTMQCAPVDFDCVEGPECTDASHCPDGYECVDEECVPRGCSEMGTACEARTDCCTGLCIDGLCSQPCDWLHPDESCPSGFYCAIQECGVGNCMPGDLDGARRGEACGEHQDCASGYCASTGGPTECSLPCDPDGIDTCPDDWSCQRIGASRCGLCACQIGMIGDPCEAAGDCASGLCATKSGDRRCSRFCGTGDPCPDGYDCLDAGVRSICWPALGGLGAACETDGECVEGACRNRICTRACESDCSCAAGFACSESGGETICARSSGGGRGGCDCAAAPRPGAAPFGLGLALCIGLALGLRRRRR